MNSLNIFLLLLSAAALAFVMIPLWRHRSTADNTLERRREKNREVFRQREGELGEDLRTGLISTEEHAKLLAELQRAFLFDMEALDKQGVGKGAMAAGRPLLFVLALIVPIASLLMYRELGSGPDLALPAIIERVGSAQNEEDARAAYTELATFLQERLDRRPDDVLNGYSLGTLYTQLERFSEAVTVLQRVEKELEDGPDRATVLGSLAQAQYLLADSMVTPDVQQTIDEALRLDPNEYAIMGLLAIDALLKDDIVGAYSYWLRQLSSAAPGSAQAQEVQQRLAALEPYLPAEQLAEIRGPTITVNIDIAPELADKITDDMRLYVFARSPQPGGPPILVQQLAVPEFPATVTLDNSNSMTGAKVESVPQVVVGARLSREPTETPGDLQKRSEPFVLAEQTGPVTLVIDEIVP
jgi:cytochrome c-type biogenesis protein CcmH